MLVSIVALAGGLVLVVLGANGLVDGASALAKRLKVSDLVIGLTVVSFGTSAPEVTVSLYSASVGETDIAIGNVVGSNIFNVFLILGVSALVLPLVVQSTTVFKEIPLSLLAALALLACTNDLTLDGHSPAGVSRTDGLLLLGFFLIFLYYTFDMARRQPVSELHNVVQLMPLWKSILWVAGGLLMLVLGGRFLVSGAVDIAEAAGVSKSVIALTIVAAGTSLPELATSVVAAYKKNADIAVGNVVGSNIFNIFFILGLSAVIQPLNLGNISQLDLLMCVLASILLFLFSFNHRLSRLEGGIFIAIYIGYVAYLIGQNNG